MTTLAAAAKTLAKLLPKDKEPLLRLLLGYGENSWTYAQQKLVYDRLVQNEFNLNCFGQKLPKAPVAPFTLPTASTFLDFQNNTFVMRLEEKQEELLEDFEIHKLKQDRKSGLWTVPNRMMPVLDLHKFVKAAELYSTDSAREAVKTMYREMRTRYHESKAKDSDIDLTGFGLLDVERCKQYGLNPGVFKFQRAGIAAAARFLRGWIADDMGLGKTRQGLGAIFVLSKKRQTYPLLIICPNSVVLNWVKEGSCALPGIKFWYARSKEAPKHRCKLKSQQMSLFNDADQAYFDENCPACQLETADVLVINYHKMADGWKQGRDKDGKKIKGYKKEKGERVEVELSSVAKAIANRRLCALIADESHYLKNGQTQWTKATKIIAKGMDIRLLLSGTPIKNRPGELEPQAEILDRIDDLGGWHFFHKRFCNMDTSGNKALDTTGSSNETDLNKLLRGLGFIQRDKRDPDIDLELPPLTENILEVEIDNAKEYEYAREHVAKWCSEQAIKRKDFLEAIAHLNPFDAADAIEKKRLETLLRVMRAEAIVRITALRRVAALGKLSAAQEWIKDFLEGEDKLVIFAHHKDVADAIRNKFKTLYIGGDCTTEERQEAVQLFQTEFMHRLITITSAAREGVTLTAARYMLMLERQWTPADEKQIVGRIERIGAKQPMFVYRMLGRLPDNEETIDHKMHRLLEKKQFICDKVIRGEITEDERKAAFDEADDELMLELVG